MKIEENNINRVDIELNLLENGNAFKYCGQRFIKTNKGNACTSQILCVNLEDGSCEELLFDTLVEPVVAKVVILM